MNLRKTLLIIVAAVAFLCACTTEKSPRSVEDFNFAWRFSLGDSPEWAQSSFDDGSWRELHLPHDWSIEGEFSADNPSTPSGGALPGGIGWYRKEFLTPEGMADGKRVFVEFDGVFMNSTVYVNGQEAGTRPYGYSSFSYDITDFLNPEGADNLIAVRCDNEEQPNSRWYAGCGIYRNVRLVTTSAQHVEYNGTYVTTPEIGEYSAQVCAQVTIANCGEMTDAVILNRVLDAEGKKVAQTEDDMPLATGSNILVSSLDIYNPHLWDIGDTYMYTLETIVTVGGEIKDVYTTPFGIRSAEFEVERGFFLNGRQVKLLGVCLHHDMGCIGTAVHPRALERELQILKSFGVNAIRTSHNPPAPELLQLADRMGFLVIDEAFDMWRKKKTEFDYARFFDEWHEKDVCDFVIRDRNHPSVIMWSAGNEILEQWNSDEDDINNLSAEQANLLMNFMSSLPQYEAGEDNPNILLTKHMVALIKNLDPTRPVTAGCNETQTYNNLLRSGALDVYGFNYHTYDYDNVREWYPDKPLFGSETASSLNSRGWYPQSSLDTLIVPEAWWLSYETPEHQVPAYDNCRAPWAELHEEAWVRIRDREYMAGTFVWTGFDYLGEPTPYSWPSRSSYFGIVDLAGFPKDVYWMYKSEWTDETVLHVFPHWNWKEGDKVDIWAYYNNADEVELFVNGRSMGRDTKSGEKLHAQWIAVPYEPGVIEVVSYRNGKEVARDRRETAGEAVGLKLTADRQTIAADGYDLSYVTIEAVDKDGKVVPDATEMLKFRVEGCGELFGIDNGNAADTLSLKGDTKAMFSGKALAVVRSLNGRKGKAVLTVESALGTASIDIRTR